MSTLPQARKTATTDECENCDAVGTVPVPDEKRHLAEEFDRLCPNCAGMHICTEEGCDEAFWDWVARAEHIQDNHTDESDRPEGAADCTSCDGEASAERQVVPDPRVDRNREQKVCPRCGDYLGGGRFR